MYRKKNREKQVEEVKISLENKAQRFYIFLPSPPLFFHIVKHALTIIFCNVAIRIEFKSFVIISKSFL